ncbi:DUF2946 family protein [Enterovibrio coralii]|uniref:Copper-binding protein n=1 Tax=Enterovibrio coralii TaxID=294935 RepID=A0A135IC81_9GAMM|nr:DUF2946 family protein [Enterovibrio coralii]KXF83081.1 hypothetical protein ATN88_04995 [Enterovibrio coralii]
MHLSAFRKFWITAFSVLVMLISSIASGAPMMTFEMMDKQHVSQTAVNACDTQSNVMAHHEMHGMTTSQMSSDCGSSTMMDHDCCPAVCLSAFALFDNPYQSPQNNAKLALINADQRASVIERAQSLYRPPIA